jgi:hypothetical protein
MQRPRRRDDNPAIEIRGVLLRAAALHTSRVTNPRAIPDPLIRHLLIVVLLTDGEERPPARSRLEQAVGPDLTERLLGAPPATPPGSDLQV